MLISHLLRAHLLPARLLSAHCLLAHLLHGRLLPTRLHHAHLLSVHTAAFSAASLWACFLWKFTRVWSPTACPVVLTCCFSDLTGRAHALQENLPPQWHPQLAPGVKTRQRR